MRKILIMAFEESRSVEAQTVKWIIMILKLHSEQGSNESSVQQSRNGRGIEIYVGRVER